MCKRTLYIISCLITFNHVSRIPVKDFSHVWCEASLTGFSHMMFLAQAANDKYCPVRIGANVLLIWGHFQKCLTPLTVFISSGICKVTIDVRLHTIQKRLSPIEC